MSFQMATRCRWSNADTHIVRTHLVVVEPNDPVLLCDEALDDCTHHALLMRQLIFALNVIRLLLVQGIGVQSQRQRKYACHAYKRQRNTVSRL